jgi:hypothetical protein
VDLAFIVNTQGLTRLPCGIVNIKRVFEHATVNILYNEMEKYPSRYQNMVPISEIYSVA